ncbi:hypothetical protein C8R45DRAFT_556865 [Mycena sanguinolenta]|nr:hypothetical protein C8R45DRAFT_556865 [Mycena sanguinolenta]
MPRHSPQKGRPGGDFGDSHNGNPDGENAGGVFPSNKISPTAFTFPSTSSSTAAATASPESALSSSSSSISHSSYLASSATTILSSQTSSPGSRNSMPPNLILALSVLLAVGLTIAAIILFFCVKWHRRRQVHPGGAPRSMASIYPFTAASASSRRAQDLGDVLRAAPATVMDLESLHSLATPLELNSAPAAATKSSLPVASRILHLGLTRSSAATESGSTERVCFPETVKEHMEPARPWIPGAEMSLRVFESPPSEGDELPPQYTS